MMKTFLLMTVLAAAALTGCTSNQKQTAETVTESDSENSGIKFEVAKNYFFKNDQEIPSSPKITTAEEFGNLFGMATTTSGCTITSRKATR